MVPSSPTVRPASPPIDRVAPRQFSAKTVVRSTKRDLERSSSFELLASCSSRKTAITRGDSACPVIIRDFPRAPSFAPPPLTRSLPRTAKRADPPTKRARPSSPILIGFFAPPETAAAPYSSLRQSFSSTALSTSLPQPVALSYLATTRSVTAPTTRAKKIQSQVYGVERLGEEMDKVFALVHGRGLGARAGGRGRKGSGLRNKVVDEEGNEGGGGDMEVDN